MHKAFFLNLFVMGIVLVSSLLPTISNAQPINSNSESWLDSLYVRIADSKLDRTDPDNVSLKFSLQVFRATDVWNQNDTTIGASDFFFGKEGWDMSKIFSEIRIENAGIHPSITREGEGTTSLVAMARLVLGKVHIYMSAPTSNSGADKLRLPRKEWVTLFSVSLKLANPLSMDYRQLDWSWGSTGLITYGNFPILHRLEPIEEPQDKLLSFVDFPKYPTGGKDTICPGEDLVLFAKAVSSANGLSYLWEVKNTDGSYTVLPATGGSWTTAPNNGGYTYRIKTGGEYDTLMVRNVPFNTTFRCKAMDPATGIIPDFVYTPDFTIYVRPAVRVALEGVQGFLGSEFKELSASGDELIRCPDTFVEGRVVYYMQTPGMAFRDRFRAMVGTIHVSYKLKDTFGGEKLDTIVRLSTDFSTLEKDSILHTKTVPDKIQLHEDGTYAIQNVWTDHCPNGGIVLRQFDTVVVKQPAGSVSGFLDPMTYVAGSGEVNVLEPVMVASSYLLISPMPGFGGITSSNAYMASDGVVGTDTLYYTYTLGGCYINAKRLVHVISGKSIAIKVLLEGPYQQVGDSLACISEGSFPATITHYISPYSDLLQVPKPFPKFDHPISDWIFVEVWSAPPHGTFILDPSASPTNKVAETSAFLLSDGTVAGVDGNNYVTFKTLPENSYYILLRHRNHLPVMSANKIAFTSGGEVPQAANTIDFTLNIANAFDIESPSLQSPLKLLIGRYLMYAGELKQDGVIDVNDKRIMYSPSMLDPLIYPPGYHITDVNFDGTNTSAQDRSKQKANLQKYSKF